jgi:hypothetical protein
MKTNGASCWYIMQIEIEMHGQQTLNVVNYFGNAKLMTLGRNIFRNNY